MSELLGIVFLCIALGVLIYILTLLISHLYQIFEEPNVQKKMRKLRKPVQPWVTVLLYSQGKEEDEKASLKALLQSYYHNFDIVVVKDYSKNVKVALKKAYKNSQKGEVVISLQAGVIVPPSFIKRAVVLKGERQSFDLRVNEPVLSHSLSGIIQTLDTLFWRRGYRARVSNVNTIFALKKFHSLNIFSILLFVAIMVVGVAVNDSIVVWYSWLIATCYLFAVIWLREEKVKVKLQLSFSALSAIFLMPVASFVVRLSQFRTRN